MIDLQAKMISLAMFKLGCISYHAFILNVIRLDHYEINNVE